MPNSSQSWETGVPSRRCRLTAATFSETGRWRRGCSDMARYLRSGYANPHEGFFQFRQGRNRTASSVCEARVVDHHEDDRALYYWQLVKRPVDHIFKALEPLASNLGFAVARISHLLGRLAADNAGLMLGENLFETYPAATLQLVWHTNKLTGEKYKGGKIVYRDGRWQGQAGKKKDEKARKKEKGKNDG